jgi:hypothetical protein
MTTQRLTSNSSLSRARNAKQDEFYTQYIDIQKEVEAYLEYNPDTFCDKVIYCNCDDPFESNFFKYFATNFNRLGLKKIITTSYDGSPIASAQLSLFEYSEGNSNRPRPKAIAVILDQVKDEDGDGAANIEDVKLFLERNKAARKALKADGTYAGGDFRSAECIEFLKEADIVVTNPPFSLFREYIAQLMEHEKKFLIIGNMNAVTYKEVFPLMKDNKIWFGTTKVSTFIRADKTEQKFGNITWFTNLDHGRRHEKLPLMTMAENLRFSKHKQIKGKPFYDRYDNYDAIEVPFTDAIPSDYDGAMGVPITLLDKYNPEQFEILGITDRGNVWGLKTREYKIDDIPNANDLNRRAAIKLGAMYKPTYARLLIRHRNSSRRKK